MALINRLTLKNYFKKGGFATEKHFEDLIDSTINAVDDGITINKKDGFKLTSSDNSEKLLSFYKKSNQDDADFSLNIKHENKVGLFVKSQEKTPALTVTPANKIGINKVAPEYNLDVNGTIGYKHKVGTYAIGSVPADGSWHVVLSNLDGVKSFEINAKAAGKIGKGYYAACHAIAISTFGGRLSRSKIKLTQAHYESFRNKIQLRWKGDMHNYRLEVRTRRNYGIDDQTGDPFKIEYNITDLSIK
ncbi:hypothetical protein [Psychroflexus salis]|uniref:Adhesin n=1 Tax=Psychroflexus salis TaxID=1526574 RepID=A0A917EBD3_9FLAO|nr:hypothetical protein [Psychroflexus salis]GGE16939.1 hypothetical protein GCM10010831_17780 [Psychroflexus salis]